MVTLTIDGRAVEVEDGTTILDAARQLGIRIPTLCRVDGFEPSASCFLCAVQVEGRGALSPSCATPAAHGSIVHTNSDDVRRSRRMALELLLSDHVGDCVGPCKSGCPAGFDIPGFVTEVASGAIARSAEIASDFLTLPAALGRICPRLCEQRCHRCESGEALSVGSLHRFAADCDIASETRYVPQTAPASGKRVAIVGAGPAGLAAAYHLLRRGHATTVIDAHEEPGGMLRYGIPAFRLPHQVLAREIDIVRTLGGEFRMLTRLGTDLTLSDLRRDCDAVFLAIGAQASRGLDCPGEDLALRAIDFLASVASGPSGFDGNANAARLPAGTEGDSELGQRDDVPAAQPTGAIEPLARPTLAYARKHEDLPTRLCAADDPLRPSSPVPAHHQDCPLTGPDAPSIGSDVVIVGGGNTAMDAARTAVRCGARTVTVMYRRTRREMPCLMAEVEAAEAEGVKLETLVAPVRLERLSAGMLQLTCVRMKLGTPDVSGRPRPLPIPDSEFTVCASSVIAAIGQAVETETMGAAELRLSKHGISVNPVTLETNLAGVFAGGDAVTGADVAVRAVAAGRLAAVSIDQYLGGRRVAGDPEMVTVVMGKLNEAEQAAFFRGVEEAPRSVMPELPLENRVTSFEEVELGFSLEQAQREASRCMHCGCSKTMTCQLRLYATEYGADPLRFAGARRTFRRDTGHPEITYEPGKCILCGACVTAAAQAGDGLGLAITGRGFDATVAVPLRGTMIEALPGAARRTAEVCPTGAFALKGACGTSTIC